MTAVLLHLPVLSETTMASSPVTAPMALEHPRTQVISLVMEDEDELSSPEVGNEPDSDESEAEADVPSSEELAELDAEEDPLDGARQRPLTRGECVDGPRPCPWATCRHNLLVDTHWGRTRDPGPFPEWTCSLDVVAERSEGSTLAEIGAVFRVSRERVRQIEREALKKVAHRSEIAEKLPQSVRAAERQQERMTIMTSHDRLAAIASREQSIIELLRRRGPIGPSAMVDALLPRGSTRDQVIYAMQRLRDRGVIVPTGVAQKREYRLVEDSGRAEGSAPPSVAKADALDIEAASSDEPIATEASPEEPAPAPAPSPAKAKPNGTSGVRRGSHGSAYGGDGKAKKNGGAPASPHDSAYVVRAPGGLVIECRGIADVVRLVTAMGRPQAARR